MLHAATHVESTCSPGQETTPLGSASKKAAPSGPQRSLQDFSARQFVSFSWVFRVCVCVRGASSDHDLP